MKSYEASLQIYRALGATALEPQLDELVTAAQLTDSQGFRYFVTDVCMDLKKFGAAIDILLIHERKFKLTDVGYNNLGYCYWELQQCDAAYHAFEKSVCLNPGNVSSIRGATFCAIVNGGRASAVKYGKTYYGMSGECEEAALWYATALFNSDEEALLKDFLLERERRFGQEQWVTDFLQSPQASSSLSSNSRPRLDSSRERER